MKDNKILTYIFFFGLFCVFLGVCVALFGSAVNSSVIIITGMTLVILSQFEVETLKLMGLEAKLKGTLNEAEVILEKMKGITLPISELAISVALVNNRTDLHLPPAEMYRFIKEIELKLEEIGASESDIKKVKDDWIRVSVYDLASAMVAKILRKIDGDLVKEEREAKSRVLKDPSLDPEIEMGRVFTLREQKNKCSELINNSDLNFEKFTTSLKSFMEDTALYNRVEKDAFWHENREICDDIEFLLKNGKVRRPHLLVSGSN